MSRITTLNEDKGKQISDLEALMIIMDKLIGDKLEENPKAGLIIAKGKPNERKIRYHEAKTLLQGLEGYFGQKGSFSLGVCATCTKFDTRSHGTAWFGTCQTSGALVHEWDGCLKHSVEGGGHGA